MLRVHLPSPQGKNSAGLLEGRNMRSALCLFGKIGGTQGKDGLGERIDYEMCARSYQQHVIDVNNCDVFMHCWDVDLEVKLTELYQPKDRHFEAQINFGKGAEHRLRSRWYSTKRSVQLKALHETIYGMKYDWVMLGRLDLLFFVDFVFSQLDTGYFYAANWNTPPLISKRHRVTGQINEPDKTNRSLVKEGVSDLWFIAPSQKMDTFARLYDHIDEVGCSGHYAPWAYMEKYMGDPRRIVKYKYFRWFDFETYRFKVCGVYR